jgi:hypothetical protein
MTFENSDDLNAAFKAHLEKQGIPAFGPVAKHYLEDPRGYKLPHAHRQQPHGRRPGKRVLMTGIRALARRRPDLDLPRWLDMEKMGHREVLDIFERHLGEVKPARGANQNVMRVVENDPDNAGGFNRDEQRANRDAKTMPAANKQGKNLRVSQFPVSQVLGDKPASEVKPKPDRSRLRPKARVPGRDVVDQNRFGAPNENTLARNAGVGAPVARGPFNRNTQSMVENGAQEPTNVPRAANAPKRRREPNMLERLMGQPAAGTATDRARNAPAARAERQAAREAQLAQQRADREKAKEDRRAGLENKLQGKDGPREEQRREQREGKERYDAAAAALREANVDAGIVEEAQQGQKDQSRAVRQLRELGEMAELGGNNDRAAAYDKAADILEGKGAGQSAAGGRTDGLIGMGPAALDRQNREGAEGRRARGAAARQVLEQAGLDDLAAVAEGVAGRGNAGIVADFRNAARKLRNPERRAALEQAADILEGKVGAPAAGGQKPPSNSMTAGDERGGTYNTADMERMNIEDDAANAAKELYDAGFKREGGMEPVFRGLQEAKTKRDLERVEMELQGIAGKGNLPPAQKKAADEVIDRLVQAARGQQAGRQVTPPMSQRPDGPATAAARERGVPQTAQMREMATADQIPVREFHQNKEEVEAAVEAGRDELRRFKAGEKKQKPNALRVAGRFLDAEAFEAREEGLDLNDELARDRAEAALAQAESLLDRQFTDKELEKWIPNLMERFNVRHRGKPEGEVEERRAKQIIKEEQQKDEAGVFKPQGRVRDRLKQPAPGDAPVENAPSGANADDAVFAGELDTNQQAANAQQLQDAAQRLRDFNGELGPVNEQQKKALQAIHYGGFEGQAKRMWNRNIQEASTPEAAERVARAMRQAASGQPDRQKNALIQAAEALAPMADRLMPDRGAAAGEIAPGRLARQGSEVAELEKRLADNPIRDLVEIEDAIDEDGEKMAKGVNAGHMFMGKMENEDGEAVVFIKGQQGQGVQEAIAWELAKEMGLDRFLPAAYYREEADAVVMEGVGDRPGGDPWNARSDDLLTAGDALDALQRGFEEEGMDPAEAKERANEALEALWLLDWVMANSDRHPGNVRFGFNDKGEPNAFYFIDAGYMGGGHGGRAGFNVPDGAPVGLYRAFKPPRAKGGKIPLSPELRAMLERINDDFMQQHKYLWDAAKRDGGEFFAGADQDRMLRRVRWALANDYINFS